MHLKLKKISSISVNSPSIAIGGSKSETNRAYLLKSLFKNIVVKNASVSDDSRVMQEAFLQNTTMVDVHHAGTAMRFLTAFYAIQEEKVVTLTGSDRMKQRPIAILVDTLRSLGAEISYLEKEGFPPLLITGKKLDNNYVQIKADVSSQYISALLLIAPVLQNGLLIELVGDVTSRPYIDMTLSLLNTIGAETSFIDNVIKVNRLTDVKFNEIEIESDWSSASYFYSIIALSEIGTKLTLRTFKEDSIQGDAALVNIFELFGVKTTFDKGSIILEKISYSVASEINLDLNKTPDLAQSLTVVCLGLKIKCHFTGLHTLKIKETDRLLALKNELTKLGAVVLVTEDALFITELPAEINKSVKIETYQDHRMALAFSPLALLEDIIILNADVVSKSYPGYFDDLKSIGFIIEEII